MENEFNKAQDFIYKMQKKYRIILGYTNMLIPMVRKQEQNIINDIKDPILNNKITFFENKIENLQPGFLKFKSDFIIIKSITNNLPKFTL